MEEGKNQELKTRPDFAVCETSDRVSFDIQEQKIVPEGGKMNPKAYLRPCQSFVIFISQHYFAPSFPAIILQKNKSKLRVTNLFNKSQ